MGPSHMRFILKSTPTVPTSVWANLSSTKRLIKLVFPTALSPSMRILNFRFLPCATCLIALLAAGDWVKPFSESASLKLSCRYRRARLASFRPCSSAFSSLGFSFPCRSCLLVSLSITSWVTGGDACDKGKVLRRGLSGVKPGKGRGGDGVLDEVDGEVSSRCLGAAAAWTRGEQYVPPRAWWWISNESRDTIAASSREWART
mmetsp:Transcript_9710/g.36438  ORF Transcript_9710/g.36438 Transcript_9710/m.36438 type:complete len:203 (-) Transcript_9710:425-1033(-)